MAYIPNAERYTQMEYRRCGRSGLKLPLLSMGLWHNFGDTNSLEHMAQLCETAFDGGITHFDLANNYGPPAGAAERNFGKLLKTIFAGHRDELVISTKAGYDMWEGPYGEWGSRKYLLASLDQSLQRLGLDYVDIFYHHRRIRKHRWRKPWEHWHRQCKAARHCTWACPTMTGKP